MYHHTPLLITLTLASVLSTGPGVVLAQTTTDAVTGTSGDRTLERREAVLENKAEQAERIEARAASSTEREEALTERQTERETVREERQEALATFRQERIINLAANISNRMDAASERLFNIVTRLETRIEKLRTAGYDTAAAEAQLRTAAETLAEVKTALANIDALVYSATSGANPRSEWQMVRERYSSIATLIRQAHRELRETIALMKTAVQAGPGGVSEAVQNQNAATSTATSSEIIEVI